MDMPLATLFRADGTTQNYSHELSLEELQAAVGGYIEYATVREYGIVRNLIVDGEGLLKHKPVNRKATDMYNDGMSNHLAQVIVGDAVLLRYTSE